ncbi:DUF3168 domain-containing protein [Bacillus mobilis]|uniref:DUF3168 domain-containing protein n=1 Tax=Bacillus mobilis TaxID=2026190 RepID=UPI003D64EE84
MAIASIELQKAVFSALNNKPYPVYDAVPAQSPMPHITIGEEVLLRDSTKTEKRTQHSITIHCWSKENGTKQVKEMMDKTLVTLLDQPISVQGFYCAYKELTLSQTIKEIDGTAVIQHGVIQITFKLMEV